MRQAKSMIPKPRLTTPRRAERPSSALLTPTSRTPSRNPPRNPTRTPSRIPRPSSRFSENNTSSVQTTATTPSSRSNPRMKRGDTLAEHVIQSGIISSHNSRQTARDQLSSYDFNRFKFLRQSQVRDDASQLPGFEKRDQSFPTDSPLTTPTKQLTASHIPATHLSKTSCAFTTPDQPAGCREADQSASDDELFIDEELVTRTPAKHKNSEWLASFGIDISLLNITADDHDDENNDPNFAPSPDIKDYQMDESHPKSKPVAPPAFRRRCATDFYGYAHSSQEMHAGPPTRMTSARKTRRASARISVRELDALKCNEGIGVEAKRVENDDIPKGSDVFLTPVRATRRQREKNGTPVVLSEVRRSLRINTPSSKLVPKNSVRGRIELLEANDHSYIPNPTLSDRSALSG